MQNIKTEAQPLTVKNNFYKKKNVKKSTPRGQGTMCNHMADMLNLSTVLQTLKSFAGIVF